MSEALAAHAKNPVIYLFLAMLALQSVQVFPNLPGKQTTAEVQRADMSAKLDRLEALERAEQTRQLKKEILDDLEDALAKALEPLQASIEKLDSEMNRGQRWGLEDEVEWWRQNGEIGPNPEDVQGERLARERREQGR